MKKKAKPAKLWCTRRDSNARPLPSEGMGTAKRPAFADAIQNAAPGESIEIPKDFVVTPALTGSGADTAGAWFLTRKRRKTGQKPVNGARPRKRSA